MNNQREKCNCFYFPRKKLLAHQTAVCLMTNRMRCTICDQYYANKNGKWVKDIKGE